MTKYYKCKSKYTHELINMDTPDAYECLPLDLSDSLQDNDSRIWLSMASTHSLLSCGIGRRDVLLRV